MLSNQEIEEILNEFVGSDERQISVKLPWVYISSSLSERGDDFIGQLLSKLMEVSGSDEPILLSRGSVVGESPRSSIDRENLELVDTNALYQSAKRGITRAWQTVYIDYADEGIYGFGFHSNFAQYALPTAFTEAGLEIAASTSRLAKATLRWSPGDSPRHLVGEEYLNETNDIIQSSIEALDALEDSADPPDDAEAQRTTAVYETLVQVLNDLSAEGLFADCPEIITSLWGAEMGWEERRQFALRCNSAQLAEIFASEDASYDAP